MRTYICTLLLILVSSLVVSAQPYIDTSTSDGDWIDNNIWQDLTSPGYTGVLATLVDSYVISDEGLSFAGLNGLELDVYDTLIVYGDVAFNSSRNNAGIDIGPNNVLIIFGDLDMGKNNAGVNIAAGGVLVVTGNITATGNNGEITGDGNYYTNGTTSGMANNSSNPEHTSSELSDDGYTSIEEFVDGGGSTSLPVELLSFTATVKSDVVLDWSTASEIDNDYFEIERSEDGDYFYKVGEVSGNGTSSVQIDYSFTDLSIVASVSYYRLRQVDYDGEFEYSPIIRVESQVASARQFSVYPTTVDNGQVYLRGDKGFQLREVVIYNMQGVSKVVKARQVQGSPEFLIQIDGLGDGAYFLKAKTTEGTSITQRFFVGR